MIKLKNFGFTVPEVAIALSITSILAFVIIDFATNNLVQFTVSGARSDLQAQAETGLDIVAADIRLSASADQNNRWPDSNAPGGDFAWQSSANTLVLGTVAADQEDEILFADASQYISYKNNTIYFVSNGNLYKRILAAPITGNKAITTCPEAGASSSCPADRKILENVESFAVRYFDGNDTNVAPANARSLELNVKLSTKRYGQTISVDSSSRTVFRND